nr:recombinase family protein [Xylella fastidiosa]
MLIGYARVSTQDQNLELQCEGFGKAGHKKVFEDKVSGTRADRPGLAKTLEMLREGDTLVVWKLDRLGRSVKQLVDLVGEFHKQGVQFRSLTASIDTGTPSWGFFFHVVVSAAALVLKTPSSLHERVVASKRWPKARSSRPKSCWLMESLQRTWPRT